MRTFRRFVSYYRPYKGLFALDMGFTVLSSLAALGMPLLVRYLLNTVLRIEDKEIMFRQILYVSAGLLGVYLVQAISNYVISSWGHIMGVGMESDMRSDLFCHMEKLSFSYYDHTNTGHLMSRVIADLFDISELAHHGPENFLMAFIQFTGAFFILFGVDIYLTLILIGLSLLMIFLLQYYNRQMQKTFMDNRRKIADINSLVQDSLAGIRTVQSFANEDLELRKFEVGNQAFQRSKRANYMVMGRYHGVNTLMQGILYLTVVLVGGIFALNGRLTGVDVITYLLYVGTFLEPIRRLVQFNEQLQRGKTGFERVLAILDTEPEIADLPTARPAGQLRGEISFENVTFAYEDGETVLEDISLTIPAQSTVALVGPSGSGKTTFCALIPRFYEVDSGAVRIDGTDVRDFTLVSLRANIGVVQQDVYIFNATVRDNIAYGKPNASLEEIVRAAEQANIHDFIMSLPQGYDTMMGERGVRFSGGQKQRVSIARIFLMNPPILILDEATSSLDNESELYIQESLKELSRSRTSIVIAHRLSTIRDADEIMVLTDDGIVERGTHADLMNLNGEYAKLYNLQFSTD
ncbi:MAG: ABC transporter ATP-binding protein [Clostridiaceae bacterium]|nr:ABC transporter ATP-binding protein [Clostridiaceae bacterium]